jgi:acyl dehydratase
MNRNTTPLSSLRERIGEEVGVSDWMVIEQDRIDLFANATDDHQFIHTDPEKAAQTPFGGTVAHGFLTLSMLSHLVEDVPVRVEGAVFGVNYGFNRVRFVEAVRSGARVRAHFTLADIVEKAPGRIMMSLDVVVEIEGAAKPALTAQWLTMQVRPA